MALGTLVLGYCLMQFDNGTASSGLSWLSVGMTMMCIAGYAMSAAPVVWILCSEIQPLKCREFWHHLLNDDKLGVEYDYRRDLPDTA